MRLNGQVVVAVSRIHSLDGCASFIGFPHSATYADLVAADDRGEVFADEAMNTSLPGLRATADGLATCSGRTATAPPDGTLTDPPALLPLNEA